MAGSAVTESHKYIQEGRIQMIHAAWTSDDAAGNVSIALSGKWDGDIIGLATVPGAGAVAPDANYDVQLQDANSLDVLLGAGANRHTSNTEYVAGTSLGGVANSALTLVVDNAGNANQGTVVVWIR